MPLNLVHHVSTVLRYSTNTTQTVAIEVNDLISACGGLCTVTNTTLQCWASSIKLKKIVIYPSSSSATAEPVNIKWVTSFTPFVTDTIMDETVPTGMTLPVSFTMIPPSKSLASDWLTSSSNTLFDIAIVPGCVVDIYIDYTLAGAIPPTSITIASGVLGNQYYLSLDHSFGSNHFVPVGLPTTS